MSFEFLTPEEVNEEIKNSKTYIYQVGQKVETIGNIVEGNINNITVKAGTVFVIGPRVLHNTFDGAAIELLNPETGEFARWSHLDSIKPHEVSDDDAKS